MATPLRPLSAIEMTALIQIKLSARLDQHLRAATQRLIHFGIVDENPDGLLLTPLGERYCQQEAQRLGIGAIRSS